MGGVLSMTDTTAQLYQVTSTAQHINQNSHSESVSHFNSDSELEFYDWKLYSK